MVKLFYVVMIAFNFIETQSVQSATENYVMKLATHDRKMFHLCIPSSQR